MEHATTISRNQHDAPAPCRRRPAGVGSGAAGPVSGHRQQWPGLIGRTYAVWRKWQPESPGQQNAAGSPADPGTWTGAPRGRAVRSACGAGR